MNSARRILAALGVVANAAGLAICGFSLAITAYVWLSALPLRPIDHVLVLFLLIPLVPIANITALVLYRWRAGWSWVLAVAAAANACVFIAGFLEWSNSRDAEWWDTLGLIMFWIPVMAAGVTAVVATALMCIRPRPPVIC